jgi:hypothetical protein
MNYVRHLISARRRTQMNIEHMSAGYKRSSQGLQLKLAALLFVAPFLVMLSTQSALGQGFKMTELDVPGNTTGTFPLGVNTSQSVVGDYVNSSGAVVGFLYAGGKYSDVIFPGSNNFTRANGINDSNTVVGDFYLSSDNGYHGYTYVGGVYTQYDVDLGKVSTSIFGVNNAGDFAGTVGAGSSTEGFVTIGGTVTKFYGSGTDNTYAYAINSSDEVVGQYFDSSNISHGFYRNAGGTITEIAYPGAIQTSCSGINDSGEITGTYRDSSKHYHGFTDIKGTFATTDFRTGGGVNSKGAYDGGYIGFDGALHGYLASPQAFKLARVKIPNEQQGFLNGVNKAGVSVGNYVTSTGTAHGMMISGGKVKNIDDPKGVTTTCFGINSRNQIVGAYFDTAGNPHGFEYTAGKFKDIAGPAGAVSSEATGINDAGQIAGEFADSAGKNHGFVLKGSTYTQLDVPGATATFAWGINTAGAVTLQWYDANGFLESSLYKGKKYSSINVPGAAFTGAHSINTAGDIVFTWTDVFGTAHGALKKGNAYFVFDYPKGSNTGAEGINDGGLIVGHYTPAGKTFAQPYKGTE